MEKPSITRDEKVIVNIVGLPGSGKTKLCTDLADTRGFELHRPSDALRKYAQDQKYVLRGRSDYQACHAEMISQDPDAMIRSVLESDAQRICIDGLRAPAAMRKLKEKYGAVAIALECPIDIRFARTQADAQRTGHRSQPTLEAFRADELPDYSNDNPNMVSMIDMFAMADHTINASAPYSDVRRRLYSIVDTAVAPRLTEIQ